MYITIANIKSLRHPVSEKKKLKMGFYVPMFQLVTPKAGPVLTPGANLVEVLKEMLYTKYQSSRPSSFREEEF